MFSGPTNSEMESWFARGDDILQDTQKRRGVAIQRMMNRFDTTQRRVKVGDRVLMTNFNVRKFKKKPMGMPRYNEPGKVVAISSGNIATVVIESSGEEKKIQISHLKTIPVNTNLPTQDDSEGDCDVEDDKQDDNGEGDEESGLAEDKEEVEEQVQKSNTTRQSNVVVESDESSDETLGDIVAAVRATATNSGSTILGKRSQNTVDDQPRKRRRGVQGDQTGSQSRYFASFSLHNHT